MDLRYSFEEVGDGKYQVRLKGEFVMYTTIKSPGFVDQKLRELGYDSREQFYYESVQNHLKAIGMGVW